MGAAAQPDATGKPSRIIACVNQLCRRQPGEQGASVASDNVNIVQEIGCGAVRFASLEVSCFLLTDARGKRDDCSERISR